MTRSCRTCKYLRVEPDKAGKRRVYEYNTYGCTWQPPEMPAMSDAITNWIDQMSGRDHVGKNIFRKQYMRPEQGTNCPTWELFVKARKEQVGKIPIDK